MSATEYAVRHRISAFLLLPLLKASGLPAAKTFMSKFMVRVVLHDAETPEQYDRLDVAMNKKGFSRELVGKKAAYQLPCGEYWYSGNTTSSEVRTVAAAAAERLGQGFGIMAVKVDGWSVMGLKKAPAPAGG